MTFLLKRAFRNRMNMSQTPSCVFIAGATGYTGRAVVQACCAAGLHTVAHVRPDSPLRAAWEQRFAAWGAEADSTPWAPGALAARLEQLRPSCVFALLGTTQQRARREGLRDGYEEVDYSLTAMLIDAAARAQTPRFVYLSAAGVGPNRGAYVEARYKAEQKLRASGLPYIIARPGLITGDRDESRPLEAVVATFGKPIAGLLTRVGARRAAAWATPMTGTQLAQALVREALAPRADAVVLEPVELQSIKPFHE